MGRLGLHPNRNPSREQITIAITTFISNGGIVVKLPPEVAIRRERIGVRNFMGALSVSDGYINITISSEEHLPEDFDNVLLGPLYKMYPDT